jgi:transposase
MSDEPIRTTPSDHPTEQEPAARESAEEVRGMPRLFGEQEPEGAVESGAVQEEAVAEMQDPEPEEPAEEMCEAVEAEQEVAGPRLTGRVRGRQRLLTKPAGSPRAQLTAEQRLLVLDAWVRSKLPATDFAPLVGVTMHTLYVWRKRFNELGPAGLADRVKGAPAGSRLAEPTRRAILLMKQAHPEWGCDRLHDMLMRTQGYAASAGAIGNLLKEEGYEVLERPRGPPPRPGIRKLSRHRGRQRPRGRAPVPRAPAGRDHRRYHHSGEGRHRDGARDSRHRPRRDRVHRVGRRRRLQGGGEAAGGEAGVQEAGDDPGCAQVDPS